MDQPAHGEFPLKSILGMVIETLEPGHATAEIEIDEQHLNPNGVVHGAVLFAMVDTAMGGATVSVLDDGLICASTDVHLRFLRPAVSGRLVADTIVVKRGRTLVQLEAKVHDDANRLVASATGAFMVIDATAST